jgi:ATP-dependent DNA helicase
MISSSIAGADSVSQKSTPASSPPPADMDDKDALSMELQVEEEKMRKQREKDDATRDAELEKERQQDISSGKEVLDKKFQQLEFLMNKSKVSTESVPNLCTFDQRLHLALV